MSKVTLVAAVAAVAGAAALAQPVGVTPVTRALEIMPAIHVTSPGASLTAVVGGNINVRWEKRGRVPDRTSISLHPGDGCRGYGTTMVHITPNDGYEVAHLPPSAEAGSYSVRVGMFGSSLFGCSPTFQVIWGWGVYEPRRSATWHAGAAGTVRWRSGGPHTPVDILLVRDGDRFGRCLVRATADDGEQRVTLPRDAALGSQRIGLCVNCCTGYEWGLTSFSEYFDVVAP